MDRHIDGALQLGAPLVSADLSDVHALYGVLVRHGVGAIVHCGAISGPMLARDDPYGLFQTNVVGMLNVLEAARRLRLRRLVFCSSLMVYGTNDGSVLREDAALRAIDTYGASKVAAEALVTAYITQYAVPAVSARLAWVYGPRRQTACSIRTMLRNAMAGRPTRLPSGRSAHRQYVHVDDVASALVALLEAPALKRHAYNVSGNDYRPFEQVAEIVRDLFPGTDIEIGDVPDPEDPPMGPLATEALERDIGWAPAVPLEQGIASYRDWLADHAEPGSRFSMSSSTGGA
jgi:nucleoside-diphosphate-sugar epimerase